MGDYSGTRVLVTGAEGFIGSRLASRLVEEGARVTALVLPGAVLSRLDGLRESLEIVPLNIRDREGLSKLVSGLSPELAFHLAALTDPGRDWANLDRHLEVNLGGTVNLLHALAETDCGMTVGVCTAEVYGRNPAPFSEEMPLDPVSPYSFSKAAATSFCRMAAASLGSRVCVLRLFLVFGPGQGPERFLPQLIKAGLSGRPFRMTAGEQTREYTYIEDAVEGFLRAARKGRPGEVYNLGSGEEVTLSEMVGLVSRLLGKEIVRDGAPLPYRENEIFRFVGDHAKARRELGWEATTGLAEGLEKTLEWFRSAPRTG